MLATGVRNGRKADYRLEFHCHENHQENIHQLHANIQTKDIFQVKGNKAIQNGEKILKIR